MSELFWDVATSDIALAVVGFLMVVAFMVSKAGMVPMLAPYALLAGLVYHLALADLALCVGFRIADERAEKAQLQRDLAFKSNQLQQQKATAEDAQRLADEKAAEADKLQEKVSDYEAALEKAQAAKPDASCTLTDDDIARLRALSNGRAKQR